MHITGVGWVGGWACKRSRNNVSEMGILAGYIVRRNYRHFFHELASIDELIPILSLCLSTCAAVCAKGDHEMKNRNAGHFPVHRFWPRCLKWGSRSPRSRLWCQTGIISNAPPVLVKMKTITILSQTNNINMYIISAVRSWHCVQQWQLITVILNHCF